jgi:hypothetical protein
MLSLMMLRSRAVDDASNAMQQARYFPSLAADAPPLLNETHALCCTREAMDRLVEQARALVEEENRAIGARKKNGNGCAPRKAIPVPPRPVRKMF